MLSLLAAPTRRIRSFVLCVVVLQTIFVIAQEAVGNFQLALARQYGRHGFRECRLDIVVFEGNGAAELHCALNSRNAKGEEPPPLKAREELTTSAAKQLSELVQASALYDGGHVGRDTTPVDGHLEVLKFNSARGTVMLVTSGNPTFARDESRRALLSVLTELEKRLLARAREK